ncbi:GNAT family N-acetyltransferase [Streptomyces sp. WI03-5b]|uniref:GNAT family N-acetyltransferase n=1 Tax=unclassified Streptomyces TaxID=2593676 RepID=UPI0005672CCA|nr:MULTISPECIES: GNAT family N-acetyltransferase [unclassified Streptomyces]MDX2618008.1 GNAT family N-acetyltransferase [Streptomyces sp. WI03-5b]
MGEYEITTAGIREMTIFLRWAEDEGWNPGRGDRLPFHAADPHGFLLGKLDAEPVTCVSAVRYGARYGFIGFYIAKPPVRGQGYGIQAWRAAMKHLEGRNVGLDGVVEQQDNYRRSGFRTAWNHVRYAGVPHAEEAPGDITLVDAGTVPFGTPASYDRRFFPGPRDAFLSLWVAVPGHTALVALRDGELRGFGAVRPAGTGARVGPLHAASDDVALALLNGLSAAQQGEPVTLDVPDANGAAIRLVERLGLEPNFECARMYTRGVPEIDLPGIYAATTIELG